MNLPPPPSYVMIGNQGYLPPPPSRRNIPRYDSYNSHKTSGANCCLRLICCCYSCLFVLVLFAVCFVALIFYVINPQVPKHELQGIDVKAFDVRPDSTLKIELLAYIKAENPNTYISFYYDTGSTVVVTYKGSAICSGSLPTFYLGHENKNVSRVKLEGKNKLGPGLEKSFSESRKKGRIPLIVTVRANVKIMASSWHTRLKNRLVSCSVVVDSLSPGQKAGILSSACDLDEDDES